MVSMKSLNVTRPHIAPPHIARQELLSKGSVEVNLPLRFPHISSF